MVLASMNGDAVVHLVSSTQQLTASDYMALVVAVRRTLQSPPPQPPGHAPSTDGGLIRLPPAGTLLVVGDLHGNLDDLMQTLTQSAFMSRARTEPCYLVFLGDYVDRGKDSVEVLGVVLQLRAQFPNRVVMLRGNHEGPLDLRVNPHDFPDYLQVKFTNRGREVYRSVRQLFDALPHAALVPERYLMVHGGIPEETTGIDDIAQAAELHPRKRYLEKLLWSDPASIDGVRTSPRGAGRLFGADVTARVLDRLRLTTLIRSHEPCEGVSVTHNNRVVTVFSRKGSPYRNRRAAFLSIKLDGPVLGGTAIGEAAQFF